jgi:hypothetical protein
VQADEQPDGFTAEGTRVVQDSASAKRGQAPPPVNGDSGQRSGRLPPSHPRHSSSGMSMSGAVAHSDRWFTSKPNS